jgi:hypothetical protein
MYSHKRSFTGQSSRSIAALLDIPFLAAGLFLTGLFAFVHSAWTYFRLQDNVRALPPSLDQIPKEILLDALRKSASLLDLQLVAATWSGLALPMVVFAIAIRWTLAPLRLSVQRSVTGASLAAFYFCSFMATALTNPDWTPGNLLVRLFASTGPDFFQGLRAVICIGILIGCLITMTKNATSKFNRGMRWLTTLVLFLAVIGFDYVQSQGQRRVDDSYLKTPASVRFIYVLPGLTPSDVQTALRTKQLADARNQLSSFQEVHPSTPSLLGQFVTTVLGIEPNMHGVRHDFIDTEVLTTTWKAITHKTFPKGHSIHALSIGGASPLDALVGGATEGERCGQNPKQLAKIGHFQVSVIPFALTPRLFENGLTPYATCSNRFLSLHHHLQQTSEKITARLRDHELKTFVIWVSPKLLTHDHSIFDLPDDFKSWHQSTRNTFEIIKSHWAFLNNTKLDQFHQTFLLGLSDKGESTTAFLRFDGQTKSQFTDLTLDSPGQRSQSSVADLLRTQENTEVKDSPLFYSEFTDSQTALSVATLPPDLKSDSIKSNANSKFVLNSNLLRKTIVNSKRHVICQNVASANGHRLLVKVSLNLRATENRLPQLTYEDFEKENLPSPENAIDLQECLKNARDLLTESVYKDVSLRDSSAFRTLLTGLPVKSIKTNPSILETTSEQENEALDQSTSAVPASLEEDEEE